MIGLVLLVLAGAAVIVGTVAWGNVRAGRVYRVEVVPPPVHVRLVPKDPS